MTMKSSHRVVSLSGRSKCARSTQPLRDAIRYVMTRWKRYRHRQIIIKALLRVNDHLLRDIGIERERIPEIAGLLVDRYQGRAAVQRLPSPRPASRDSSLERECA